MKFSKKTIILVLILILAAAFFYNLMVGRIAVVVLEGPLLGKDAFEIVSVLDSLEKDPTVRAVVLKVNSPGGSAEAVHEIYFKILRLVNKKPVVSIVDQLAASGAYYIISPTNYIFVKQASFVGGVGVIAELPKEVEKEDVIASGPFKISVSRESIVKNVERIKLDFLRVVNEGRGKKLKIDLNELAAAEIYIGLKAIEFGLVDEIGGIDDAIERAREMADAWLASVYYISLPKKRLPLLISSEDISSNTTTSPVFYYIYTMVE